MQQRNRTRTSAIAGAIFLAPALIAALGADAQPLTQATRPETEVSNDRGDPLAIDGTVTVDNAQPIDVISRFPNRAYTLTTRVRVFGGEDTAENARQLLVPAASHLRGITLSASHHTGYAETAPDLPRNCIAQLLYPEEPALRPPNQDERLIVTAELAPGFGTVHIPLYEMFVGSGVPLVLRVAQNQGFDLSCEVRASLHLRPIPGGIQPD
jgi:hypothetical protein